MRRIGVKWEIRVTRCHVAVHHAVRRSLRLAEVVPFRKRKRKRYVSSRLSNEIIGGGREGHSREALFRNYITLAKYNIYNFYIYIIIIYIIYNFWDYKSNLILGDLGEDYIFIIYNLFYRMKFLYML